MLCHFCFAVLCVLCSFPIISLWRTELVALHFLCSECHVVEQYPSLTLPHCAKFWSVECDVFIVKFTYFLSSLQLNTQTRLLLLTCCLLLLPLWESVIVLCFIVLDFMSILVMQSS